MADPYVARPDLKIICIRIERDPLFRPFEGVSTTQSPEINLPYQRTRQQPDLGQITATPKSLTCHAVDQNSSPNHAQMIPFNTDLVHPM